MEEDGENGQIIGPVSGIEIMGASVDEAYIERLHEDIRIACEHLENNGFESIIVTVGKSGNVNMGSARGKLFLDDRLAFVSEFINFCKAQVAEESRGVGRPVKRQTKAEAKDNTGKSGQPPKIVVNNSTGTHYESKLDGGAITTIVTKAERFVDDNGDGVVDDGFIDDIAWKETGLIKQESDGDDSITDTDQPDPNKNTQFVTVKHNKLHSEAMSIVIKTPVLDTSKVVKQTREKAMKSSPGEAGSEPTREYKCHKCNKSFDRDVRLQNHLQFHEAKPLIDIKVGHKKYMKPLEKCYTCDTCTKQFTCYGTLTKHRKKYHQELRVHNCDICNKTFSAVWLLRDHVRMHTGEKPFSCNICNKNFRTSSNLSGHQRSHSDDKPYKCDICLKCFKRLDAFKCHKRIHSNQRPYVCETCGKGFTISSNLTKHRRIHTGERPYGCDSCEKRFYKASDLTIHRRTHTGETPYICDFCGRMFACRGNLVKHTRIHTGEKPYECKTCDAKFSDSSALVLHERIHSGTLPYCCEICGKKSRSCTSHKAHKQTHSGERNYVCDICNKGYKQTSHLARHRRTHLIIPNAETIVIVAADEG